MDRLETRPEWRNPITAARDYERRRAWREAVGGIVMCLLAVVLVIAGFCL